MSESQTPSPNRGLDLGPPLPLPRRHVETKYVVIEEFQVYSTEVGMKLPPEKMNQAWIPPYHKLGGRSNLRFQNLNLKRLEEPLVIWPRTRRKASKG